MTAALGQDVTGLAGTDFLYSLGSYRNLPSFKKVFNSIHSFHLHCLGSWEAYFQFACIINFKKSEICLFYKYLKIFTLTLQCFIGFFNRKLSKIWAMKELLRPLMLIYPVVERPIDRFQLVVHLLKMKLTHVVFQGRKFQSFIIFFINVFIVKYDDFGLQLLDIFQIQCQQSKQ